ncbi:glycine cleavage system aminomethyltransferase GcvT [Maritimibacter sp. DP1N21-5]|uniref:glycine cleavage system aminomethyltransferase GcvT n=1 Tax=Maritimibacter sp. DP1N21-5 TaxID=2836867 RepID=UPI001C466603|nr:glycine cleavage system aminomethyltransferase GcvT [Maritimibacter sp. DP1N21-5]MBV7408688.1 glycine cleavage system aminomethyltransferase GcvT [Maritimibacter sp. DP1N21-5]
MSDLKRTGLYDLHLELGAKMVSFAGWEMPVQYPMGVLKEHLHTRADAGLFDVSHMGQIILRTDPAALEALVPVDVIGLPEGRQRYALFTNDEGGILDDLMIANRGDHLFVVVNAAMAEQDVAHLRRALGDAVEPVTNRALLALQGPKSEDVLAEITPSVVTMRFMDVAVVDSDFGDLWISRSGYAGEDGFEISVADDRAEVLARALLAHPSVAPIGLGARDSLRLEAGLPLYGSDLDTTTTPVEADLGWAIQKVRRTARTGFPGAHTILNQLSHGPARRRVGLAPKGRAPMRAGVELFANDTDQTPVGHITSGAFGPSVEAPISMGYVATEHSAPGTLLYGELRGKRLPVAVTALPFRPATYKR